MDRHERINKRDSKLLRSLLMQCVWTSLR
ncbi:MAG: hypothetical protein CMM00_12065 [Rhodopirellula sp.]|nr:hypothetical protein [Rhodopirellula sp.]